MNKFLDSIANPYTEEQITRLQENLIIIPIGERLPLDKPQAKTFIHTMMDQIKPDGVIIDSLVKLVSTSSCFPKFFSANPITWANSLAHFQDRQMDQCIKMRREKRKLFPWQQERN